MGPWPVVGCPPRTTGPPQDLVELAISCGERGRAPCYRPGADPHGNAWLRLDVLSTFNDGLSRRRIPLALNKMSNHSAPVSPLIGMPR